MARTIRLRAVDGNCESAGAILEALDNAVVSDGSREHVALLTAERALDTAFRALCGLPSRPSETRATTEKKR